MEEIKVESKDGKLFVRLPNTYKEPYWLEYMYGNKCIKNDDGTILIPCRNCNVTISRPIIKNTPMGRIQTLENYSELWVYFDVPQLSALVKEGENLLDNWSLEELKIEIKEKVDES